MSSLVARLLPTVTFRNASSRSVHAHDQAARPAQVRGSGLARVARGYGSTSNGSPPTSSSAASAAASSRTRRLTELQTSGENPPRARSA